MGEQRGEIEIVEAVTNSNLEKKALKNKDLSSLQVGRGSIDDYMNVFSHQDEEWVTGLPRRMWDFFEGKWHGNIVSMSFEELIAGLNQFGGQLAPDLVKLCESGNLGIAHDRAFTESNLQDGNAVFVYAMHSTTKLVDTKLTNENYAILDDNFSRGMKVYLYAFQNLMAPQFMLYNAKQYLILERAKQEQ
jgi:hypothetical protein